jgi:hypothetical protein
MEQRCYRFHTHPRICDPVWSSGVAPVAWGVRRVRGPLAETMKLGLRSGPGSHTLVCGELLAQRLSRMSRLWNSKPPMRTFGLATSDWSVKLMPLEQVGGRAHEAQFGFVWNGGGAA